MYYSNEKEAAKDVITRIISIDRLSFNVSCTKQLIETLHINLKLILEQILKSFLTAYEDI